MQEQELAELTVKQLQEYAEGISVPLVGRERKAELIQAIIDHQRNAEGVEGEEDPVPDLPEPEKPFKGKTLVFRLRAFGSRLKDVPNEARTAGCGFSENMALDTVTITVPEGCVLPGWILAVTHEEQNAG